jgi:hypothetical protein
VLSNHPLALLRAAEQECEAQAAADRAAYEEALTEHAVRVEQLIAARDAARAERRWLAWLRRGFAVRSARRRAPRAPVAPTVDPNLRASIESGMNGEEAVQRRLAQRLDDDWTLICGYRGRGGEIDQLLLGPRGLLAIEVKYRNATVSCDGDAWWYDKYDRYGNHVDSGTLADRRGRSPSQQVNQATDALESFLRARGCSFWFARVIVFAHARSRIGELRNPRVQWICTSIDEALDSLLHAKPVCSREDLVELGRLIERDHDFNARRGSRRGAQGRPQRGGRSR